VSASFQALYGVRDVILARSVVRSGTRTENITYLAFMIMTASTSRRSSSISPLIVSEGPSSRRSNTNLHVSIDMGNVKFGGAVSQGIFRDID
jgi:hypothetical protein